MLQIDAGERLRMDTRDFVSKCTAVLGMTDSGKTNTAAVIIEELLSQGLPMTIVDIEGEYYGLKERYELLVVGRSEHAELEIGPENAAQLAEISVQRGISVILDLSEYSEEEQYEFLVAYFTRLWEVAGRVRKPYQVILEEAHEFIPQGVRTPLKQMLTRIALRGRKRGLGIILMSQRSAKVEKDVLTQAAVLFLQKVVHPIDIKVYKDLVPLAGVTVEALINDLHQGQAIVVANNTANTVSIRLRHTFHAGATPEFGAAIEPELRKIDAAMLKELQDSLKTEKSSSSNVEAKQARRIAELETILAERDAEIARLLNENALLSKLEVSMRGNVRADVSLPETMQIEQASINHVHMPPAAPSPRVVEATMVRKAVPTPSPAQKELAPIQRVAAPLNERKFHSFKQRLKQVSGWQRNILAILTEKEKEMSVQELAAWLNVEESRVQKNPPTELMRLGLIQRWQRYDGFYYSSRLREQLQAGFPGHDVEDLVKRVFQ